MRSPTADLDGIDISVQDRDEVIRTANIFVDELLAKAQHEAQLRKDKMNPPEVEPGDEDDVISLAGLIRRGERSINRARGVVQRLLTSFRICK
ncbi:hypothetical protein LSTR_LSTR005729 [Laodelphax striatellus]|uniref:Uncharacterized protein n=1 Tax=Laodelphax striatellus TaxID=195883 RepID=A0A482XIN4_LAOST|nr:hypothetical protein LSTR_LSTR005729 [Laodelphax striatellus]